MTVSPLSTRGLPLGFYSGNAFVFCQAPSPLHASAIKPLLAGPNAAKRPLLTVLNGDNSWLMSFPRPPSERTPQDKTFYHIVLDPWLTGDIVIGAAWLV